jgi:ATP-binding cassette subfamily B protein
VRSRPRFGNLRVYGRLLLEARSYWPHIAALSLLNLLAAPIALLTPVPLKIAVDSIAGGAPLPTAYTALLPGAVLQSTALVIAVTAALLVLFGLLEQVQAFGVWLASTYVGERLILEFRAKLFRHVQRLSLSYHDARGTTDSIYRIQYDAPAIQSIAVSGLMPFVSAMLTLAAMLWVIARIDGTLAIVALATMPLLFLVTYASIARLKDSWNQVKQLESSAMSVLQEVLGAIRLVKAFTREDHEHGRFVEQSQRRLRSMILAVGLQMKYDIMTAAVIAGATAVTLAIGVVHVKSGTLSLGGLLLVMAYLAQLYGPMRTMASRTTLLQSSLAGAERAFALLDEVPDVAETHGARRIARSGGGIEFRHVTFGYPGEPAVLRDVSFRVEAGARVGIAGPTGAGKTTLLNLLMRFYDPREGTLLLDGVDLRELNLTDVRDQFAIVHQEPVLFSTSIGDNIAYARPDASTEEIERAARAARAHDFIAEFPDGYDTIVGERGMRLSGGERQRISLARAFLKNAPILLLDEPTSSVDIHTEAAIIEALNQLMVGRTTFMIAHRLSTLDTCDVQLHVDRGLVVQSAGAGAHDAVGMAR